MRDVEPLPERCQNCKELEECNGNTGQACWECDYACDRFVLIDENGEVIVL